MLGTDPDTLSARSSAGTILCLVPASGEERKDRAENRLVISVHTEFVFCGRRSTHALWLSQQVMWKIRIRSSCEGMLNNILRLRFLAYLCKKLIRMMRPQF